MRGRDFIQNITITLLLLSALFLFSRTQFFQLGAAVGSGTWQRLTAPAGDQTADAPASDTLSAPVRAAVTGEYGRYGSVSLTTDSEDFTPIKTLLREVLGSARSRIDASAAAFQAALGKPSVYCDFLEALPVPYLADLMGVTVESPLSVRALAAAEQNGQIVLLLWDGGARYYQCATAAQPSTLTDVLDHFELGVTAFAFEDLSGYGQQLAPLSLFPDPLPELPQLTVAESAVSTETLLSVLSFNPPTNSRYTDAGGAEVVVEGDRVVRISGSGSFSYTSGGETALSVETAGGLPAPGEAVSDVLALLDQLTPEGDARLYLLSWRQTGSETVMTFGYQSGGVPIRFADGSAAAEVTLTGSAVSALSLRCRQYSAVSAASPLLPLRQAMAIAGRTEGAELSIGYADTGAYPLSAVWLTDRPHLS